MFKIVFKMLTSAMLSLYVLTVCDTIEAPSTPEAAAMVPLSFTALVTRNTSGGICGQAFYRTGIRHYIISIVIINNCRLTINTHIFGFPSSQLQFRRAYGCFCNDKYLPEEGDINPFIADV